MNFSYMTNFNDGFKWMIVFALVCCVTCVSGQTAMGSAFLAANMNSKDPALYPAAFTTTPTDLYNNFSATEQLETIQFKYGIRLNVPVENLANLALLYTIDEWWGTRYRMGGTTKNGIDCSAFTQMLMNTVYSMAIPRTAHDQYNEAMKLNLDDCREGDLVFFSRSGHSVGHVGMYLGNNRFVHASSSKGVMISNLDDSYWVKRFVGAGRIQKYMFVQQ